MGRNSKPTKQRMTCSRRVQRLMTSFTCRGCVLSWEYAVDGRGPTGAREPHELFSVR